jgi:hypothetical protein
VLVAELDGAANAEDAVVALLGRQALEGQGDGSVLFLVEVVVPVGNTISVLFRLASVASNLGVIGPFSSQRPRYVECLPFPPQRPIQNNRDRFFAPN